jgi:hypothetical protein
LDQLVTSLGRLIIDLDGESLISIQRRYFASIGRCFIAIGHHVRRLIVDFDRESSLSIENRSLCIR